MSTETSPRWNARILVPLIILGIAVVVVAVGLWLGGSFLFGLLAKPVSLPSWCIVLLAVGPAVLVGSGILWLWIAGHKRGEMERRPIIVKGVRWRWWIERNGRLRVVPYCEACDLQLRPQEASADSADNSPGFVLRCNSCGQETERFRGPLDDAPQLILDHFMQNIRKEFELSLRQS